MPYITKDQVTAKRKQLKAALPEYKLSITTENYSGIKVAIMSGPTDFETGYSQLNPYMDYRTETWNRYTEEYDSNPGIQDVLDIIMPILNEGKGASYEDGDYGMIPDYYTWVHIGKWDKAYEIKTK
tara:strand:+ start:291 stop:668 length:378 start_codon:yes stop_codon:yes gene_type:complete